MSNLVRSTPKISVACLRIRHVVHQRRRSTRVDDELCQLRAFQDGQPDGKRKPDGTGRHQHQGDLITYGCGHHPPGEVKRCRSSKLLELLILYFCAASINDTLKGVSRVVNPQVDPSNGRIFITDIRIYLYRYLITPVP